ncbi:MAG: IS30 family transposase, partial [Fusobacterium gastrosuis]|nr:IS30 family transposase [Fusobacterium gastrosuis]
CSGERGSNENNNKLIRRHIAKGMDIGLKSEEEVRKIEKWMNTYPRKLFNGKSSIEIYFDELGKYFS